MYSLHNNISFEELVTLTYLPKKDIFSPKKEKNHEYVAMETVNISMCD